jgi:hypothetical protein
MLIVRVTTLVTPPALNGAGASDGIRQTGLAFRRAIVKRETGRRLRQPVLRNAHS